MSWADDMWTSAFSIAESMAKRSAALKAAIKEAKRLRRNERARRRYAINKTLPKKPKPEPIEERYEPHTSCYCANTRPPCSWCTRELDEEDAES